MTIVHLYLGLGTFVMLGFLWFFIGRPILEGFGIIAPREVSSDMAEEAPAVMSREVPRASVEPLSSLDGQSAGRTDSPQPSRDDLLTLYKVLRKYGVPREEIRAALKGVRVPLSNDVWAAAAPPPPPEPEDEDVLVTPIAGRVTRKSFYPDDPDLEYSAPTV